MTRSRLLSLVLATMVVLAGLGVGAASASSSSPSGSLVVRGYPPVCC
jgi:hypothetical protein